MIKIKSKKEIELIKEASGVAAKVISRLKQYLRSGVTTEQLDKEAERILSEFGAVSAFKGYKGYPANICTSVNEEIVHGIPSKRKLNNGDIISLDVGAKLNGYFGDVAHTFGIGTISSEASELLAITKDSLNVGIEQARNGNHLYDISSAIQNFVEARGYSVVRKFVGHGIGAQLHEEPEIPNFGRSGLGPILKSGMVLAIEPMVNEGNYEIEILADGWTAITKDKRLSAHFEHTICITENKAEILTLGE